MRAVNIPVIADVGNVGQTPHAAPFFFTIGYTMSYGDDMYRTISYRPTAPT
jgi:hypothetical protein